MTSNPIDENRLSVYCPACGEQAGEAPIDVLSPGQVEWTCPECGTVFLIEIGFVTLREPDDIDSEQPVSN